MMLKTLLAAAVAAAFTLTAQAEGSKAQDKASSGSSAAPAAQSDRSAASGASSDKSAASGSSATSNDGGAAAMFKSMDKNGDGSVSKEEAKGTPHEKDFAKLDKNGDGKLSAQEHAAAPEHQKAAGDTKDKPASSGASAPASGKSKY